MRSSSPGSIPQLRGHVVDGDELGHVAVRPGMECREKRLAPRAALGKICGHGQRSGSERDSPAADGAPPARPGSLCGGALDSLQ